MKVCPRCGRTERETPFIGFFCRDCYLELHPPVRPADFEIKRCPTCGRIFVGRWTHYSLTSIAQWLKKRIKISEEVVEPQLTITLTEKHQHISYHAILTGRIGGTSITYRFGGKVRFKWEQCPYCARRAGEYYEAVIQIRGKRWKKLYDVLLSWLPNQMDPLAFITKELPTKNGIDVYIGSKKVAEKFSRKARQLGAAIKISHSLVTVRDGKPITREYLSLRLD